MHCYLAAHAKMDTLGFEPRALRMRSGWDTTTPRALEKKMHRALCPRTSDAPGSWKVDDVPVHLECSSVKESYLKKNEICAPVKRNRNSN